MLSAIFCAVPAPIRVDPATTSGGVASRTGWSAMVSSAEPALLAMPITVAPFAWARRAASSVKGVVPLAETVITVSAAVRSARSAARLPAASSSAPGISTPVGMPPAIRMRICCGGIAKVPPSSSASDAAISPEDPAAA